LGCAESFSAVCSAQQILRLIHRGKIVVNFQGQQDFYKSAIPEKIVFINGCKKFGLGQKQFDPSTPT
jgi:hypothetical protein